MTVREEEIVKIDACLPQTQCTLCGYPRCMDYAQAISRGEAQINRCAPGGETTVRLLASLRDCMPLPLEPECDRHQGRQVAVIREQDCIGCTLCLAPCPVDAIVGAAKHMHTVVSELCTGCRLCIPYCPVDCIDMIETQPLTPGSTWSEFTNEEVKRWRLMAERHFDRLAKRPQTDEAASTSEELKQQIREAVNRGRKKRWRKKRRDSAIRSQRAASVQ